MVFSSPNYVFRRVSRQDHTAVLYEAPLEKRCCAYEGGCRTMVTIGLPYCATHRRSVQGLEVGSYYLVPYGNLRNLHGNTGTPIQRP